VTLPPLLGIAIPTYRRPDQLSRCVASIIRSAGPHQVPIHIADDSTDDTNLAAIEELRARYPFIVHHRNPRNLGIDRNIVHAVDLCESRHVWIMGEDDRLTPEAVPAILDVLKQGERPFVYVNYLSADEDLALVLREHSLPLGCDAEKSAEEFLAADAWSMGFIGACVVEKVLWRQVRPEPYLGTYFAHVGVILQLLVGRRAYLVAKPLVINRVGTTRAFTWAESTFDVLTGWGRMIDRLRAAYPKEICDRAAESFQRAHAIGSVPSFCYLRADGALNAAMHERYVRSGPYPAFNRRASWWIARAPPAIFRAARWALMSVRRARNRRLSGY
jgi:glycosyltransferase involved in cell wall biosynthesis